jgi:hypothetical protein
MPPLYDHRHKRFLQARNLQFLHNNNAIQASYYSLMHSIYTIFKYQFTLNHIKIVRLQKALIVVVATLYDAVAFNRKEYAILSSCRV